MCLLILLISGFILTAGCSKYAEPELKFTTNITKISDNPANGEIVYDVAVSIANTGQNNAYQVKVLTVLSTPRDLPEYRFTNKNSEVGEVEKGTTKTVSERMTLMATKTNYDLLTSGSRSPDVEVTPLSVSSNVMG